MSPINGQQFAHRNPMATPPRMQPPQEDPAAGVRIAQNQYNVGAQVSGGVPLGNHPPTNAQPNPPVSLQPTSFANPGLFPDSRLDTIGSANIPKTETITANQRLPPPSSESMGQPNGLDIKLLTPNSTDNSSDVVKPVQHIPTVQPQQLPYGQNANQGQSHSSLPRHQNPSPIIAPNVATQGLSSYDKKSLFPHPVTSGPSNANHPPQVANQARGSSMPIHGGPQPATNVFNPLSVPSRNPTQNVLQGPPLGNLPPVSSSHYQQQSNLGGSQNLFGGAQNITSGVSNVPPMAQNLFGGPHAIQPPSVGQNLPAATPQNRYPPPKAPSQYPPHPAIQQPNLSGSYLNLTSSGPTSELNQQSLASQRKYPQSPHIAQAPTNTASLSGPMLGPPNPLTSQPGAGQFQAAGMPPMSRMPPPQQEQPMVSYFILKGRIQFLFDVISV